MANTRYHDKRYVTIIWGVCACAYMREYVKRESNRSIEEDINKMKWLTGFFNVFSRLREIIIFRVTIKCRVYAILRFFFFFFC